jgi:hypothetical protein
MTLTAALSHCCPVSRLPCFNAALSLSIKLMAATSHCCPVSLPPFLCRRLSLLMLPCVTTALSHCCAGSLLPCLTAALSMSITLPCLTSLSHDPCFSVGVLRAEGISMFSPTHTGSPKQPSCGDELMLGGRSEGTSTPWLTL